MSKSQEARTNLLDIVKPGAAVYTIVRHVSRSGMQRSISAFVIWNNEVHMLDYWLKDLLDLPFDRTNGGLKVRGAGMDMTFWLVYETSRALFCPTEYDHDLAYSLKKFNV